jgi:16S rRNA (cytidine1402-2'-O)-methyltransferase
MGGTLSIVATPIGNLGDLTERARATLAAADLVACEDTRRTGSLLHHLGIKKRLLSLHEHNERQRLPALLEALEGGSDVALVSDAGTPLLSDPGYRLVTAALEAGHRVVPIPGASAVLAALVCSGLPPMPFTFCGFPPPKSGRRRTFFERFAALEHTLVLFESPHRLAACLADAVTVLGAQRPAALARELTKLYETVERGSLGELAAAIAVGPTSRGEHVLVVGGASRRGLEPEPEAHRDHRRHEDDQGDADREAHEAE